MKSKKVYLIVAFFAVALIVSLLYYAMLSPQNSAGANPKTPGLVWSTNAEVPNLRQIGIENAVNGNGNQTHTVTISDVYAHNGSKSFQLNTTDNNIEFNMYPGSKIQNDFYFSWWVYIPSQVVADLKPNQWFNVFQLEGSILPYYDPIYSVTVVSWQAGNHVILYARQNNNTEYPNNGVLADSSMAFQYNRWVHFEFYAHIGTNGTFQAWMDNAKLWDVSGIDNTGLKQEKLYFMTCLDGTSGSMYVDDLALYNLNMNGTIT